MSEKLFAKVSTKVDGEVSTYQPGEDVEVTSIYGDKATIQDMRGYRCIVCVPLRLLDFSELARRALEEAEGKT